MESNATSHWPRRIGRAGYLGRAALYALIAAIALDAVVRLDPNEPVGVGGAFGTLVSMPGGRWLLGLLAVGLLLQAVWRGLQACTNIERGGARRPTLLRRLGWACIGIFYGTLCFEAVALLHGLPPHGAARASLARVLAHPLGRFAVVGVAVGLCGFAIVQWRGAWRASFLDDFDRRALGDGKRRLLAGVGRVGLAFRGLVFACGGALLMRSAWRARAETVGIGDVLRDVAARPFGIALVGAIAIGLLAYAALMVGEAVWRRNVQE